ncbi:hypothetical protein N7519_005405 [Penicillium mononematosum]|uniref:uncharacterized protein n=1 Tax=Penicillium mononematosum TaxID=268346 RepID=UPI00254879F8|nr:uncharacterized protein N7519_005405 [Penicillium mononematosum]KAJ6184104.1 hypothetical protein N7519_005405 [Penicillium mononematosum]
MIIGSENVGETEKANDCRNDTSGFRLIAKLPNRNRLIPGVPPLVTAAPSHTYTQNRFFSDSVSLKALDSQASQEASSRVSAKPNGVGHRAHRSRPRSKLPQDSSAAALYTSQTSKPIVLLTCQHAIRTYHLVRLPRQTHGHGHPQRQTSSSCCTALATQPPAFPPSPRSWTCPKPPFPVPLPFDLGSFDEGDNVAFNSTTGTLDMNAGLTRSTVSPTSCAENAGYWLGRDSSIGAVRRTKEVIEFVEASRYACRGDWDAVESGRFCRWYTSGSMAAQSAGSAGREW